MGMARRVRTVAAAAVAAIALVSSAASWQGVHATALGTSSPLDVAARSVQSLLSSPGYVAAERAVLAGRPVPLDAKLALEAEVTRLAASPAFLAAVDELAPLVRNVAVDERGVPEFMYHVNEGNERMVAAVNVFTVLVVPGILNCSIGSAPSCVSLWLLVGAGLASGAVLSGAQEYVAAVLALP